MITAISFSFPLYEMSCDAIGLGYTQLAPVSMSQCTRIESAVSPPFGSIQYCPDGNCYEMGVISSLKNRAGIELGSSPIGSGPLMEPRISKKYLNDGTMEYIGRLSLNVQIA